MNDVVGSLLSDAPAWLVQWCATNRSSVDSVAFSAYVRSLEAEYSKLMYGYPKTRDALGAFNNQIMGMDRRDVVAILGEAKDGPFRFRSLLNQAREQYDGALRWVRKEYVEREDGTSKNITIGTRVVTKPQPQQYKSDQGSVPPGHGVVEEAQGGESAKRAVGTTAAWRVRFDPSKPVVPPKEESAEAKHPTLNWIVQSTDWNGKPTERWAQLPRLFWPDLGVVDHMSGPQHPGVRGRYEVLRRIPGNRYSGGAIAAEDAWETTGFAFNNLKDLWAHLQDQRDTRLGTK